MLQIGNGHFRGRQRRRSSEADKKQFTQRREGREEDSLCVFASFARLRENPTLDRMADLSMAEKCSFSFPRVHSAPMTR